MKRDDDLISAATSAYRARDVDGNVIVDAAWLDLDDAGRLAAFDATVAQRRLEATLAPDGLSTTSRAILSRIVRKR